MLKPLHGSFLSERASDNPWNASPALCGSRERAVHGQEHGLAVSLTGRARGLLPPCSSGNVLSGGRSLPGVPAEGSDAFANLHMSWHRLASAPGSANRGAIADRSRPCFGLPDPGTKPLPCFLARQKGPLEREPCELMNVAVEGSNSFHGGRQGITPRDRT